MTTPPDMIKMMAGMVENDDTARNIRRQKGRVLKHGIGEKEGYYGI
jgi:hypothetical protein